jgi:Flp pilus assembly protein TadG
VGARSDRGASAVELVIIAPALLFASMLIISFAMWFDARHAALAAAQQGDLVAREEAGNPQLNWKGDATSTALRFYHGLDTSALTNISVSPPPYEQGVQSSAGQVADVTVTVQGTLNWIWHIKISETVTGPVECFHTLDSGGTQCP